MEPRTKRAVYERYLMAWSPVPASERRELLAETTAADIAYLDANGRCSGREGVATTLDGFQVRRPGYRFAIGNFLQFDDAALVNWHMLDADGKLLVEGFDSIRFSESEQISSVIGFSDLPKQQVPG